MNTRNMKHWTQKQFENHFKKQARAYTRNMCIFCRHNDSCELPLHGKFRMGGKVCQFWEEPDMEIFFPQVTEYFYGKELKDKLMEKLGGGQ